MFDLIAIKIILKPAQYENHKASLSENKFGSHAEKLNSKLE